jgi:hypothetical protein
MDEPLTTTETPRGWIARAWACLGTAWSRAEIAVFYWWHTGNRCAAKALASITLLIVLTCLTLAYLLRAPGSAPAVMTAAPTPARSNPLQDQIDSLRLRVIALENPAGAPESADPQPARPRAPRAALRPAAGVAAAPPAVPAPTTVPPDPITRQSIDQFRASLRTSQPVQE